MDNFPGILVALAPFAVLALLVIFSMRRSSLDKQEIMRFGRQTGDSSQEIRAALKENNALLRDIVQKLDRLEARNRQ